MYNEVPSEQSQWQKSEGETHEEENLRETRTKREPIVVWVTPDSGIMNNSMLQIKRVLNVLKGCSV